MAEAKDAARASAAEIGSHKGDDPATTEIRKWPAEPHQLQPHGFVAVALHAYDVCLVLIPVLLMIKAGLVIKADRDNYNNGNMGINIDQVGPLTTYLIRFNGQLTTLFTILFVSIVATLVRRYALWKAQRGASVAELEQFQASISLPGTLKTVLSLRAFTLTSLGLILIWSFYYLGSQASKAEYAYHDSEPFSLQSLMTVGAQGYSQMQNTSITDKDRLRLYQQTLVAVGVGSQFSPYDGKGRANVPILEQTDTIAKADGWHDVSQSSKYYDFWTSAQGLPAFMWKENVGVPLRFVGKFRANTSYFVADCSTPTMSNGSSADAPQNLVQGKAIVGPAGTANSTAINNSTTLTLPLFLNLWQRLDDLYGHTRCQITRSDVEDQVQCSGAGCAVKLIRYTPGSSGRGPPVPFDQPAALQALIDGLQSPAGVKNGPDYADRLIDTSFWKLDKYMQEFEVLERSGHLDLFSFEQHTKSLSTGISQLINTYYLPTLTAMCPDSNIDELSSNFSIPLSDWIIENPCYQVSIMKGAPYGPEYRINMAWLVIDFISNFVLLVAAIFSFWLRTHTLAPDIFGYVSSLTRDNPNLELPTAGSTLSGMERAKLMRDVKIRIVGLEDENGLRKIGVVPAKDSAPAHHLSPKASYV